MKTKAFIAAALMAVIPLGLAAQREGGRAALEVNGGLYLSVCSPGGSYEKIHCRDW